MLKSKELNREIIASFMANWFRQTKNRTSSGVTHRYRIIGDKHRQIASLWRGEPVFTEVARDYISFGPEHDGKLHARSLAARDGILQIGAIHDMGETALSLDKRLKKVHPRYIG